MPSTVAYTSSKHGAYCRINESTGENISSTNLAELLDFLIEPYEDKIKVAWKIDDFVKHLISMLPENCRDKLKNTGKCYYYGVVKGSNYRYKILYSPGRHFGLACHNLFTSFYNLWRFYGSWPEFYQEYRDPTDVGEVKWLGDNLIKTLNYMGFYPTKLASPAAIYEECVLEHMSLPTIDHIPEEYLELVSELVIPCCDRPWISAYKVGHWAEGKCFDYDINGAFQSTTADLFSTYASNVKYTVSDLPPDNAHWGYMLARLEVEAKVHPIVRRSDDGSLDQPTGTWEQKITLQEAEYIRANRLGYVRPTKGIYLHFKSPYKPFEILLQRLYGKRKNGGFPAAIAKQIGASVWGKFLEEHPGDDNNRYGKYFNPFYGAQVPTQISLKVADGIYSGKLQNDVIHVATDGFLSQKEASFKTGTTMGGWRLASRGPAIVLSPNLFLLDGKKSHGLDYTEAYDILTKNPKQTDYGTPLTLPLLENAQDRVFSKFPKCGADVLNSQYDSEPVHLSLASRE